jgi:hypothetical protein
VVEFENDATKRFWDSSGLPVEKGALKKAHCQQMYQVYCKITLPLLAFFNSNAPFSKTNRRIGAIWAH